MKKWLQNQFKDFQQLSTSNKIYVLIAAFIITFFSILASSSIFLQKELRTSQDIRKDASVQTAAKVEVRPGHQSQLVIGQTHNLSLYLKNVTSAVTDLKLTFYISTDKPGVISDLVLKQPNEPFINLNNDNLKQLNPTTYQVRFLGLRDATNSSRLGEVHLADVQLNVNKIGALKIEFDPGSFIYTADDRNELAFDTPILIAAYDPNAPSSAGSTGTKGGLGETTKGGLENSDTTTDNNVEKNEPAQTITLQPTTPPPQPTSPTTTPTKPLSEQTAWDAILGYLEEQNISLPLVAAGGLAVLILIIGLIAIVNQLKGTKEPDLADFSNLSSKNNGFDNFDNAANNFSQAPIKSQQTDQQQPQQPEQPQAPELEGSQLIDAAPKKNDGTSSMVNRLKEKGITQPPRPPTA